MEHKESCLCQLCLPQKERLYEELLISIENRQNKALSEYGFYIHYDIGMDGLSNYHTHGLEQTMEHMNFQIVFPLKEELAHEIFWIFAYNIKNGVSYVPNNKVFGVIEHYPIQLIKAREEGRNVLRIILPDSNGYFPDNEKCHPLFSLQNRHRISF